MKKLLFLCLMGLLINQIEGYCKDKQESSYYKELKTFKENPKYKAIFDEDVSIIVPLIYRDMHNFKQLTYWQRFARFLFFDKDVVIVTPDSMPQLYSYVQSICDQQSMPIPTIFITRRKGVFNAFAAKLFSTTGGIALYQKIIEDTTDSELEAIIAHELGHIKHNHSNKIIARILPLYITIFAYLTFTQSKPLGYKPSLLERSLNVYFRHFFSGVLAGIIAQLTIGKQFEKEADEFAYKEVGNEKGLIEFFKHVQDKENAENEAFDRLYVALEDNKPELSADDHQCLCMIAKMFQGLTKGFKWVYYNTRFGPHPSPQERQKTVEEYLAAKTLN